MYHRIHAVAVAAGVVLAAAACSDLTGSNASADLSGLSAAFNAVPAAFSDVESSFEGGTPDGFVGDFADGMRGRGPGGQFGGGIGGMGGRFGGPGDRPPGFGERRDDGGPGFGGLMGGGMLHGVAPFLGGGRPRPGDLSSCTLGGDGRVTCPDQTHGDLTISRSFAFTTAGGTAQAQPDSTTNTVNARMSVSGTVVHPRGDTSVVSHSSDRTITGLAAGSTQRTINSSAEGSESTHFVNREGTAIAMEHQVTDAEHDVVVPVGTDGPHYPISGSVERTMHVSVTEGSDAPRILTRSETVTYDGTDVAHLVITVNGDTKTCSLPLTGGRPSCE